MRNLLILIVLLIGLSETGQAQAQDVYRCGATTTKGTPCKLRVKTAGAKCWHHAENGSTNQTAGPNGAGQTVYTCGATTAKGTPCKRRVKLQGAKCYSHEG